MINENGRFTLPSQATASARQLYGELLAKRDEDLFQSARLVTCGLYIHIVMNDYIRIIMDLRRTDTDLDVKLSEDFKNTLGPSDINETGGNQVSIEFDLLCRWHSTISSKEEQWMKEHLSGIVSDGNLETIVIEEMFADMSQMSALQPADPGQRTWDDLQRQAGVHFDDADLAEILMGATEDVRRSEDQVLREHCERCATTE